MRFSLEPLTDVERLAQDVDAVLNGVRRFQREPVDERALRLTDEARQVAEGAAVQLVRQIAEAASGYQGDSYYRMARHAMERASAMLAGAWAVYDETPPEELAEDTKAVLVVARMLDPETNSYVRA
jgi:hypothetical protein